MKTPKKVSKKSLIATFPRRALCLFIAAAALFAGGNRLAAAATFTPAAPLLKLDFENLATGDSLTTQNWIGSTAGSIVGVSPSLPASNPSGKAIGTSSTTRTGAVSPAQAISPAFTTADTVYFSAWMNRTSSLSSGARILLYTPSSAIVGGFGILDGKSPGNVVAPFALYANGGWEYSSEAALANTWYELALVVAMDPADLSLSLGSLFVRNITAGETSFRPVADLSSLPMGYTASLNATAFANWRIDSFRTDAQLDNLSAGLAIPEPKTATLALGCLVLLGCSSGLRRFLNPGR